MRRWAYAALASCALIAVYLLWLRTNGDHLEPAPPSKPVSNKRLGHPARPGALRLEGIVLDDRDHPVSGADVTLFPGNEHDVSDSNGHFDFAVVPGRFYVEATGSDSYSRRVAVQFTPSTKPLTLRMIHGSALVVRVFGEGAPIGLAQVSVESEETVTTDATGSVRIGGRWPGRLVVTAEAPGYARESGVVYIEAGQDAQLSITLQHGAPLAGTVVNENGVKVAGATVEVDRLSDRATVQATTDASGAWRVQAVAAGRYHVSARSADYGPTNAKPLDVDGKSTRDDIVVRVDRGATVFGKVTDAHGDALKGVRIGLQQVARRDDFWATTDERGDYEIRGLPAGTYIILRYIGKFAPANLYVDVLAHQRIQHDFVVDDDTIDGRVFDEHGAPVADAFVNADMDYDTSDSEGGFHLTLPKAGTHELTVGWTRDRTTRGVDTRVDGTAHDVRLVLPSRATVTGRVMLDGAPATAFAFVLDPEGGPFSGYDNAEPAHVADGRFRRELHSGTWNLQVTAPGCDILKQSAHAEAGKTTDLGDLVLSRGRRIVGLVRDAGGMPIADAKVELGWQSADDAPAQALFTGTRETKTDASGAFAFEGVAHDRRHIRAVHPTLGVAERRDVAADQNEIDLVLTATGAIDGVIDGFRGDETYVYASLDGKSQGSTGIDRAGEFHFENLPAGRYLITQELDVEFAPLIRPVYADVTAGHRTKIMATMSSSTVSLQVRVAPGACKEGEQVTVRTTGEPGQRIATIPCIAPNPSPLRFVEPRSYLACTADQRCQDLDVTSSTKSIEIGPFR